VQGQSAPGAELGLKTPEIDLAPLTWGKKVGWLISATLKV
jgi:hypothetical protein